MYNSNVVHILQIKLENRLEYVGNGTYPSGTFSVSCLSVFLYFEFFFS